MTQTSDSDTHHLTPETPKAHAAGDGGRLAVVGDGRDGTDSTRRRAPTGNVRHARRICRIIQYEDAWSDWIGPAKLIKRQNLTMRMSMKRFARLSNDFSKKVENPAVACAIHFHYYHYARIHKTLRMTPAMEAEISDHVRSFEAIVGLLDRG